MIPGIKRIVDAYLASGAPPEGLVAALSEREDDLGDALRIAGSQYGLFPEIVAEVLASIGFGTPPTPEARQMIRDNYNARMEDLRRQFGGGQ